VCNSLPVQKLRLVASSSRLRGGLMCGHACRACLRASPVQRRLQLWSQPAAGRAAFGNTEVNKEGDSIRSYGISISAAAATMESACCWACCVYGSEVVRRCA
jgi:hypothetical protein